MKKFFIKNSDFSTYDRYKVGNWGYLIKFGKIVVADINCIRSGPINIGQYYTLAETIPEDYLPGYNVKGIGYVSASYNIRGLCAMVFSADGSMQFYTGSAIAEGASLEISIQIPWIVK